MSEPRNKESCNAVYLRNGTTTASEEGEVEKKKEKEVEEKEEGEVEKKRETEPRQPPVKPVVPIVPYPSRLKPQKDAVSYAKFLDIFKKLTINIPFADALAQMPSYARFMKDVLSKKRRVDHQSTITLTEECSAIFKGKLPNKLNDPGSFSIPVQIGNFSFSNVLCDLGASINLMPLSIFRKLGLGEVSPTNMMIELADRSVRFPYGVIEDVLVKVGKFYFPVDFVVVDIEEDDEVPLILGRPFLATSRALIDMEEGEITFRVGGENVRFKMLEKGDDARRFVGDRKCGRSEATNTKSS